MMGDVFVLISLRRVAFTALLWSVLIAHGGLTITITPYPQQFHGMRQIFNCCVGYFDWHDMIALIPWEWDVYGIGMYVFSIIFVVAVDYALLSMLIVFLFLFVCYRLYFVPQSVVKFVDAIVNIRRTR